jgi:hypothetical protein
MRDANGGGFRHPTCYEDYRKRYLKRNELNKNIVNTLTFKKVSYCVLLRLYVGLPGDTFSSLMKRQGSSFSIICLILLSLIGCHFHPKHGNTGKGLPVQHFE